ncbi:PREDICTED: F-box/LRR-repeat protein At5g02910-like [Lupinus angustifolius]|uniref:F-box/LRR-repeat protein At5g02910-like n=1 Tax=Lupinus angustifolius TaxID=3871 RepID=UPI00092FB993|nr:PREDICTED: F-box/LRR-repeat protein At5g02910-like [Lupinus angustifolius]
MSHNKLALNNENQDFISQLPEPIIHYILSSFSDNKDCAKTCFLSKTWRNLYYSRPNMFFHEEDFIPSDSDVISLEGRSLFLHYVEQSLNRRIEMNCNHLERFKLHLTLCDSDDIPKSNYVNLILEKVIGLGVKTMSLKLCFLDNLSHLVLDCKTLVNMHLDCFCFIKACKTINIPNLKTLSLFYIDLRDELLEKLISGCPRLQILSMSHCSTSKTLQLLGLSNLVELNMSFCIDVKMVEIGSLFFHNLVLEDFWSNSTIMKVGFETMKKLHLSYGNFFNDTSIWLSNELSAFKGLTELRLIRRMIKGKIYSQSMKKLVISHCRIETKTLEIHCPNLVSFEYEANHMPFKFVSECVLEDFRYEFSLLQNGRSEQMHALNNLVLGSTFTSTKNLKVVIVLGGNKAVFILEGLNKLMLSILNKVDDQIEPMIFITSHSIDWNAIMPTSPSVTFLAINVISLSDSTFFKEIWENFLCLKELQPRKYANICCVKKDYRSRSIPIELQPHEGLKYEMTRIILEFVWSK